MRGATLSDRCGEPLDQLVPWVQLENPLGAGVELPVLLQQALQMHVHVAFVGDEADGAVGQAVGAAHVLDRLAERQLEDRDETGELGRRRRALLFFRRERRDLVEIRAAARRRFERLVLVAADRRHPELVDRVGHQQDFDAAGAEAFELRALLDDVEAVAGDRVDRLLALFHRRKVVVERKEAVARRGAKAREPQERVLLLSVLIQPLLQHGAEIVPKLGVFAGRFARLARQFGEEAAGQLLADLGRHRVRLKHLAADVEWQVLAVDDAAQESQIGRQKFGPFVGDEDAPDIEPEAALALRVEQVERLHRRHEEQIGVFEHSFGLTVQGQPRLVEAVRDVAVEFLVLLVGDL